MRTRRRVALLAALGLLASLAAVASTSGAGAASGTIWVRPSGSDTASCGASAATPCKTIQHAVDIASPGSEVFALWGTYHEQVTVTKNVWLNSSFAVIDATGHDNGILLQGPGASGSRVSNFTVENANGEGILATLVDHVTIQWNRVTNNDQGATDPNTTYPQCLPSGQIPGDCGEGLHLQATTNSSVIANRVFDNVGGILLSDDMAANHGNLVAFNWVQNNKPDCGITVPAHNPAAGVYDNQIEYNRVTGNGEGGVLIAAGVPGSAAHDNLVRGNYLEGNGFAGVTLHSHAPGQSIANNVIDANIIKTNNVTGDDDAGVFDTTGVLVFKGAPGVDTSGIVVSRNVIANNHFGVWLSPGVTATITNNAFANVTVHVQS
jgi:hypothetical protein